MNHRLRRARSLLAVGARYLDSSLHRNRYREELADVENYCMFIGYPRSGHSLLGSLLDAHPDMVIAHEFDALRYVDAGFGRKQLYYLLVERSKWFSRQGRTWYDYSYEVPNQWNGRFRRIRVIGDKKGGQSSERLADKPDLLEKLKRTIETPVKIIHVARNPFDNIATMSRRMSLSLHDAQAYYFWLCDSVVQTQAREDPADWLELRHEDLVNDPQATLARVCAFLGQTAAEDYLRDCASIVFDSPKRSRWNVQWSDDLISGIEERMKQYPFLSGYTLDG